ncbi:hypothetical protein [Demequina sp. SO4-18]|uniref:hypothetical protein n=1 Tax=Demequina sp. SO4-18 TaxID=3401026 RepID=UPI003B59857C
MSMRATARGTVMVAGAALALGACGAGDSEDGADASGGEASGPDITVGADELDVQLLCSQNPDQPGVLMVSSIGTDVDVLDATLGGDDDHVYVEVDDVYWEASENLGEITSLDVDAEGSRASGEATFENQDGDTEEGSFDLSC